MQSLRFFLLLGFWSFVSGPVNAAINVTIGTAATTGGSFASGVWTPTASPSRIHVNDLLTQLNAGKVTINTAGALAEPGNITISSVIPLDDLTTAGSSSLTLNALNDLAVNAALIQNNPGGNNVPNQVNIVLKANSDASGGGSVTVAASVNTGGGTLTVSGVGLTVNSSVALVTGGGNFNATMTGPLALSGSSISTSGANLTVSGVGASTVATDCSTSGGNISIITTGSGLLSVTGDLDARGGAGVGTVNARMNGSGALTLGSTGSIRAGGDATIRTAAGKLTIGGLVEGRPVTAESAGGTQDLEIQNTGSVLALSGRATLSAGNHLTVSGPVSAAADIVITADSNNGGVGNATTSAALTAKSPGISITGINTTHTAGVMDSTGGLIQFNAPIGTVTVSGGSVNSGGGAVTLNATNFALSAPITTSGGSFTAEVPGGTSSLSSQIATSGGNISVSAGTALDFTGDLVATGGAGTASATLKLTGPGTLGLVAGSEVRAGGLATVTTFNGKLSVGGLVSGGTVLVESLNGGQDLDIVGGTVTATGAATLRAGNHLTISGSVSAGGTLAITADSNGGGLGDAICSAAISGGGAGVTITGVNTLHSAGTINSNGKPLLFSAPFGTTTMSGGIVAGGGGNVSYSADNITVTGGTLNSGGGELRFSAPAGTVSLAGATAATSGGNAVIEGLAFSSSIPFTTSGGSFTATGTNASSMGNDITSSGGNITVTGGTALTFTAQLDATGGVGTGTASVGLSGTGALALGPFSEVRAGGVATVTTANGMLTVDGHISGGSVLVESLNGTQDLLVVAGAPITASGGTATLRAGNHVTVNSPIVGSGGILIVADSNDGGQGNATCNASMTSQNASIQVSGINVSRNGGVTDSNGGLLRFTARSGIASLSGGSVVSDGGNVIVEGGGFAVSAPISTMGGSFSATADGSGGSSLGGSITTLGGNLSGTLTGNGGTLTVSGSLNASGNPATGAVTLLSNAGPTHISSSAALHSGSEADVVISGNTGVVLDGDIVTARNVDVDCVTGGIAIGALASIANSGTLIAFDAANSTITTAPGAIITPGASSLLHLRTQGAANDLTVNMPLASGTAGLELFSDRDIVINAATGGGGPVTIFADMDNDGTGAVNATAEISTKPFDISIEGKGVTLADVSNSLGVISISNQGTALHFNGNISAVGYLVIDSTSNPVFGAGVNFDIGGGGLYILTHGAPLTIPSGLGIANAGELVLKTDNPGTNLTVNRALVVGGVGAILSAEGALTLNAPLTSTGPVSITAQEGVLGVAAGATISGGGSSTELVGKGLSLFAAVTSNGGNTIITNTGSPFTANGNIATGGGNLTITSAVAMTVPSAPVWNLGSSGIASVNITGGNLSIPANLAISNALRLSLIGGDVALNRAVSVGVGGVEFLARDQIDINASLSSSGPILLRADSDANASGVLFVSSTVTGTTQPVTLRGNGIAVLADVATTTGEIRIEPGASGSANIAAALGGPSRLVNGTTTFTVGSVSGSPLNVDNGAALAFDNASRTISPAAFTQNGPLGETRFRLGGTNAGQFNRILAASSFTAAGQLTVQLEPGFTTTAGMSFDVLDFASFGGAFSSFSLPTLGTNQVWDTSQLPVSGTLRILTPIELWRQQHFGTIADTGNASNTADANGDGEPNLIEYALNQHPLTGSVGARPVLGKIHIAGEDYLTLTITRPLSATDIEYQFRVGNTLPPVDKGSRYSPSGDEPSNEHTTEVSRTPSGAVETIVVRDNVPIGESPSRFMTLEVTVP